MNKLRLILLIFTCCLNLRSTAQSITLFKDHHTDYRIVIPEKSTENERIAAKIMSAFLQKAAGTEFLIFTDVYPETNHEILIGFSKQAQQITSDNILQKLSPSGYYITQIEEKLIILGGTGKGVIHGVTHFLEEYMGFQYLSPTVQIVPKLISFNFTHPDILENPATEIRIVNGTFGRDSLYRYFRRLDIIDELWANTGDDRYYVHTFNRLIPPDEYFNRHPEYFSMINGERVKYGQLCLSNQELVPIVVNKLREAMKRHPGKKLWSVSQNDNYYSCQCDECRHTDSIECSPAGTLLRFVNQVSDSFPDQTITTLAYQYTRKPPIITKPRENVMITHCSIELNRSKPIEEDPGSQSFVDELEGWNKICNNIKLWDYEVQFTNYLCPFPLWHTLAPNIRLFNKNGTTAHFQQCNAHHGVEFAELKSWLMSHLLWNPKLDADSLIRQFMRNYYGTAAPLIMEYFELYQSELIHSGQGLDIYGSPVQYSETFLSKSNVDRYNYIFDEAEKEVLNNPDILERVKIARLPVTFSEIEIARTDIFGERGWFYEDDGKYRVRQSMKQKLDTLYAVSARNAIPYNESGLTPQVYYENSVRSFNVSIEGNQAFGKPVLVNPEPAKQYTHKGASMLTNGVSGNENWKLNWLGWEGKDCEIEIDLQKSCDVDEISISTLNRPDVWILHPASIEFSVSANGKNFEPVGKTEIDNSKKSDMYIKDHKFIVSQEKFRYIRFVIISTKTLPAWHAYSGQKSWVFVDEVTCK